MEASDAFRVHVCTSSGLITAAKLKSKTYICSRGRRQQRGRPVYMPLRKVSLPGAHVHVHVRAPPHSLRSPPPGWRREARVDVREA
jgi:hypothetical protein